MQNDMNPPVEGVEMAPSEPTASSQRLADDENCSTESLHLTALPAARRLAEGQFVITVELQPPKVLDDPNFQKQLKRYQRLVRTGWVDAITVVDFPRFAGKMDNLTVLGDTPEPIFTIAANARRCRTVVDRITRAIDSGAKGILVVSGGHPIRKVPGASRILPMNSFRILSLLHLMRGAGQLPSDLSILAVENPFAGRSVTDSVDRLQQKLDARAEAILTQPPLLWELFAKWWHLAFERGLTQQIPIVVGLPIIASVKALRFWFLLVGISQRNQGAHALLEQFKQAEAAGKEAFRTFRGNWTVELIQKICELPDVAGIHLMPIQASRDIEKILAGAKLAPADRAREDIEQLIPRLQGMGAVVVHEPGLVDPGYVEEFGDALEALKNTLGELPAEWRPGRFRTYWNRIAYKHHFRAPIAFRPFVKKAADEVIPTREWELAIDLRQHTSTEALAKAIRRMLKRVAHGETESANGVVIGEYVPYTRSLVWQFNDAFWQNKTPFMTAHDRDYRDSIHGSPDMNEALTRYTAEKFLNQLEVIGDTGDEYVYVEIGIASVERARIFIEMLGKLARSQGIERLLKQMRYVLADFSKSVLSEAEAELGKVRNGIQLAYLLLHAEAPLQILSPYAGRILRVHSTNVTDNVPTDKVAQIDGHHYRIEARLYLPAETLETLVEKYNLNRQRLAADLQELSKRDGEVKEFLTHYQLDFRNKLGPEEGDRQYYHFWSDLWNGFKLEERYVAIPSLVDLRFIETPEIPDQGKVLQEILAEYPHNVWMHLSNRAIEGGLQILQLLHPQGVLEIIDLLVKEISDYHHVPPRVSGKTGRPLYRSGFKGPAKYEGSAVDWINARLLRRMAERLFPNAVTTFTSLEQFDPAKEHMSIMELCPNSVQMVGSTN